MLTECDDLAAEVHELAQLCAGLSAEQWATPTDFYGWSAWDEVAHLCYFDETALLATRDAEAFAQHAAELMQLMNSGGHISAVARAHFGAMDGAALLARWQDTSHTLLGALRQRGPKDRLPWYGPSMSARSFATARLMETWAHGQDVWDAMGRTRTAAPRHRAIAHLGVSTLGWTFANRGLPVPGPLPWVELESPVVGEAPWTWGEPSATDWLRGSALDFCLLVTQRRHRSDTALRWAGPTADAWTQLAQCFAGPPADGPGPGARRTRVVA